MTKQYTKQDLEIALAKTAEEYLEETYNLPLTIPIKIDGRLKRSLGAFHAVRNKATGVGRPKMIKLSKNLIEHYPIKQVMDTLLHELTHYALFMLKKPYRDGEVYFENELHKYGISATQTSGHIGKMYHYTCDCGIDHPYLKRDGHHYLCGNCKSGLTLTNVEEPIKVIEVI